MKELFVPYEIALLAKEKGFDKACFGYYLTFGNNELMPVVMAFDEFKPLSYNVYLSAPLYQQLVDWFYTKGIDIGVSVSTTGMFQYYIWLIKDDAAKGWERTGGIYGIESRNLAYIKAFEEAFKLLNGKENKRNL